MQVEKFDGALSRRRYTSRLCTIAASTNEVNIGDRATTALATAPPESHVKSRHEITARQDQQADERR